MWSSVGVGGLLRGGIGSVWRNVGKGLRRILLRCVLRFVIQVSLIRFQVFAYKNAHHIHSCMERMGFVWRNVAVGLGMMGIIFVWRTVLLGCLGILKVGNVLKFVLQESLDILQE